MQIYLPIAEIPINILLILSLGFVTGIMAGLFGIGGGFIGTPMLIFIGISPAVAVSTSSNQIAASSFSGVLAHVKKNNIDFKMGSILVTGGFIGSILGVMIFKILKNIGQIDIFVSFLYITFLALIGFFMLYDNLKIIIKNKYDIDFEKKNSRIVSKIILISKTLPFQQYFPKSDLKISLFLPLFIGLITGILVAIMGIGGGFIMVPAMIYLLKMPHHIVTGTSLLQIVFVASLTTILQSINNQTVDIVLAFLMIISSVFGAQIGTILSEKINPDKLKLFLSLMIVGICLKMLYGLFIEPDNLFNIEEI
jgi:uncharacterized membrane protein YfcA